MTRLSHDDPSVYWSQPHSYLHLLAVSAGAAAELYYSILFTIYNFAPLAIEIFGPNNSNGFHFITGPKAC